MIRMMLIVGLAMSAGTALAQEIETDPAATDVRQ